MQVPIIEIKPVGVLPPYLPPKPLGQAVCLQSDARIVMMSEPALLATLSVCLILAMCR